MEKRRPQERERQPRSSTHEPRRRTPSPTRCAGELWRDGRGVAHLGNKGTAEKKPAAEKKRHGYDVGGWKVATPIGSRQR